MSAYHPVVARVQMDTYNEMNPSSSDPSFLQASNAAVYNAVHVSRTWPLSLPLCF